MLDNRIPINWELLTLFKSNLLHLQHAGRRTTGITWQAAVADVDD